MSERDVLLLIDRHSFPVKCDELEDLKTLMSDYEQFELDVDDPTVFFNQALLFAENHELVVPVTRNFYIRDKLKMEGVSLIICL